MKNYFNNKVTYTSIAAALILSACGGGGGGAPAPIGGKSYLDVYVSPSGVCSQTLSGRNVNIPCVSVTICEPNNASNCTTVSDVLLDTGSFGLRVFKPYINGLTLPNLTSSGSNIAECVTYGDGTQNWGPVVSANVQLASDATATNLPIQVIDSTYPGKTSASCESAAVSSDEFGANGVLGVGPVVHDSGPYYSCNNGSCIRTLLPKSLEVANPIAMLPNSMYNNGLTLIFPSVGASGASNIVGKAIFGVGTNSKNQVPATVNVYPSSPNGIYPISMPIMYNSQQISGFLDTGSNFLSFTDNSISLCSGNEFYCPSSTMSITPSNMSSSGNYITTDLTIGNADSILNSSNNAFSNVGVTSLGNNVFDYGLPFFFGKTVYVGFSDKSSTIASGSYWAF